MQVPNDQKEMTVLPLSERLLSDLEGSPNRLEFLSNLNSTQLAALNFLYLADTKLNQLNSQPPHKIQRAIRMLITDIEDQDDVYKLKLIDNLANVKATQFVASAKRNDCVFVRDQAIRERTYLSEDGVWNPTLKEAVTTPRSAHITHYLPAAGFSADENQDMFLHTVRCNQDESLNLQGFAGVGKSTLIIRLSHLLNRRSTLYLGSNRHQVSALKPKLGDAVRAWDFNYLPVYLLMVRGKGKAYWGNRVHLEPLSFYQYREFIDVRPLNGFSTEEVASIVNQTLYNYCISSDDEMQEQHFPRRLSRQGISPYIFLSLAKALWNAIKEPNPLSNMPVHGRHLMKIMDEMKLTIPAEITHIIIDESHDLPPSLANVIQRSPQATIALGDEFQITDNSPRLSLKQPHVREYFLNSSLRTGHNADGLLGRVLGEHTQGERSEPFHGCPNKRTNITLQNEWQIPDQPCALLSDDYWYAFLAAKQLLDLGRSYCFLPVTKASLSALIPEAYRYYCREPIKRKQYRLMDSEDWNDLVSKRGFLNGLQEVDQAFKHGFSEQYLNAIIGSATDNPDKNTYIIGLVPEAKSKEFQNVCLAPDVVSLSRLKLTDHKDSNLNKIYTGLTRATSNLILPHKQGEWLLG